MPDLYMTVLETPKSYFSESTLYVKCKATICCLPTTPNHNWLTTLLTSLFTKEIKNCTVPPHDYFVPSPSGHLQRFSPVTEEEVRAIIFSSSNASCLLDPVPTWLVKLCVNELAPIITNMINSSLENGCVPDS